MAKVDLEFYEMAGGFDECEDEEAKEDEDTAAAADGGKDDMLVEPEDAREGEEMEQKNFSGVDKMDVDK